ncbi:hypothetical protein KCP69_25950 [Salmonella enterica subsp. enterica]|nr:hypothetical protein KCP69_25950 [Salmonella enterica subsp. enterica]
MAASLRRRGTAGENLAPVQPVSYREHEMPRYQNLLKQDFTPAVQTRNGRVTSLRTDEGWLYAAVVIDLWSRALSAGSMSSRMTAQLACTMPYRWRCGAA